MRFFTQYEILHSVKLSPVIVIHVLWNTDLVTNFLPRATDFVADNLILIRKFLCIHYFKPDSVKT